MSDPNTASWWHDDGIFRYRKLLVWEPIHPIVQCALQVIATFHERDRLWQQEAEKRRQAWEALSESEKSKPWVTEVPPPRSRKVWQKPRPLEIQAEEEYLKNLMECRNRQPGRFGQVWSDVVNRQTGIENQSAFGYSAFPTEFEPDYPDLETAGYYHEIFCWAVALRFAFRILDLFGASNVKFPFGWIHVVCPASQPDCTMLVASASFQMGVYFAKAQAMQRVPQVCRSLEMTSGRKGKINPFGETVMQACEEMHSLEIPLQGNKASRRVLEFLASQGQAELNPSSINGEDAPAWKINRFITKFLKLHRLYIGKTRSAKNAK